MTLGTIYKRIWIVVMERLNTRMKCALCLGRLGYGFKAAGIVKLGLSHGTAARFWRSNREVFSGFNRHSIARLRGRTHRGPVARTEGPSVYVGSGNMRSRINALFNETLEFYSTGLTNDERRKKRQNEAAWSKYHSDVQYAARCRLRKKLRDLLIRSRCQSVSERFVGCGLAQLVSHFESQFQDGMTWGNYGWWEIDHVIPCASFDLTLDSEIRKCFHYTNLRPLKASENRRKGRAKCVSG